MGKYYGRRYRKASRRFYRRNYKKNYWKRRRFNKKKRLPLNGQPNSVVVKLRYCEAIKLEAYTTGGKYEAYSANNIYDPRYALGGHQPMGRDTYASMYNHYVVLGAKATFVYNITNSSSNYGEYSRMVGMVLDDNGTFDKGTTATTIVENGKGVYKLHASVAGDTNTPKRLVQKFSAKKYFGVSNVKDNKDNIGASVNDSPNENAFFLIYHIPLGAGAADPSVAIVVNGMLTIDYIVQFSEKKELDQH